MKIKKAKIVLTMHPGEILREDCFKPSKLPKNKFAAHLGVSRKTLDNLMQCKTRMTVEMAHRLELAGLATARQWLDVQQAYDLETFSTFDLKFQVTKIPYPEDAND